MPKLDQWSCCAKLFGNHAGALAGTGLLAVLLQMEDMKGKIRVYCRCRPMLPFELDKGQKGDLYQTEIDAA